MQFIRATTIENYKRYTIQIKSVVVDSMVFYMTQVIDISMGIRHRIAFRFSELKTFHSDAISQYKNKNIEKYMPKFPPTRSFLFWNHTNSDERKIQKRRRQLEMYIEMMFNNPSFDGQAEVCEQLLQGKWYAWSKAKSVEALYDPEQKHQTTISMPLNCL